MDELIPEPARIPLQLSKMHAKAVAFSGVTWTDISKLKTRPQCTECVAFTHENWNTNRGACQPIRRAAHRRTCKGQPTLELCGEHYSLVRQRDGK